MRPSYIPTVAELQAFSACAGLSTTTRAAQSLNLTQSAVSRSINSLEERLGVRLFHRVRQRLILSDAGRALQRDAEKMLENLNQTALMVMAFGGHSDVVRLAALPTFASTWLIPRLARFQSIAPNITFDVSARLGMVDFETEPFDAAIQRGDHRPAGAQACKLVDEYLVVIAAPSMLHDGLMLEDHELAKLPLLQQATRPTLWLDWFRNAGLDPRAILRGARFDHFDMVINAAIAGLGVALVPEILARKELAAGSLLRASERRLLVAEPYTLIYPPRSEEIEGFVRFRDWMESEAQAARHA